MHTFTKEERLCNKRLIDGLFHNGSSFLCYPFRVSWLIAEAAQPYPVQILFAVAKKRFKHAIDRNLIKRRMREAYRLNKQSLYATLIEADKKVVLSVGYIGKEIADCDLVEKRMRKLLMQLEGQVLK